MERPAGDLPASSVATTRGGVARRSTTDTRVSAVCRVGSAGSTFWAAVTSARDWSGVSATLSGGPTTLAGTAISATIRGGDAARSSTVSVSGGGLATTRVTPSTRMALLSFAETASSATVFSLSFSGRTTTSRRARSRAGRAAQRPARSRSAPPRRRPRSPRRCAGATVATGRPASRRRGSPPLAGISPHWTRARSAERARIRRPTTRAGGGGSAGPAGGVIGEEGPPGAADSANWTTIPRAWRGWRNASFQLGRDSFRPTIS